MVANKLARKREQLEKTEIQAQVRWVAAGVACGVRWGGQGAGGRCGGAVVSFSPTHSRACLHAPLLPHQQNKEELKTVALGTSKINYLDPRITVAWCACAAPGGAPPGDQASAAATAAGAAASPHAHSSRERRAGATRAPAPPAPCAPTPPHAPPRAPLHRCKRNEVPMEKVFNKSLLTKFLWAMDVEPEFRF